jgi:hypothetical protein
MMPYALKQADQIELGRIQGRADYRYAEAKRQQKRTVPLLGGMVGGAAATGVGYRQTFRGASKAPSGRSLGGMLIGAGALSSAGSLAGMLGQAKVKNRIIREHNADVRALNALESRTRVSQGASKTRAAGSGGVANPKQMSKSLGASLPVVVSKGSRIRDTEKYKQHPTNLMMNRGKYQVEYREGSVPRIAGHNVGPALLGAAPGAAMMGAGVHHGMRGKGKLGAALYLGGVPTLALGAGAGAHRGMQRSMRQGDIRITDRKSGKRATGTRFWSGKPSGWE